MNQTEKNYARNRVRNITQNKSCEIRDAEQRNTKFGIEEKIEQICSGNALLKKSKELRKLKCNSRPDFEKFFDLKPPKLTPAQRSKVKIVKEKLLKTSNTICDRIMLSKDPDECVGLIQEMDSFDVKKELGDVLK